MIHQTKTEKYIILPSRNKLASMTPCAPSRKIACRAGIEWVIQRQRFGFTVHSLQESRMNDEHNMKKITNIPSIRVPSGSD